MVFKNLFTKFAAYKIQKELKKLGLKEEDLKIDPKKLSLEKLQELKAIFDEFIKDNPHLKHIKKDLEKGDPEVLARHRQEIERWVQKNRKKILKILEELK